MEDSNKEKKIYLDSRFYYCLVIAVFICFVLIYALANKNYSLYDNSSKPFDLNWYYENGEMKMESDIVSGYPSESRNTPAGVYKLWLKERGKTLVGSSDGQSYASYVEFWNYFSTIGIGFHDASWQGGVFGGEKYQSPTWGSHGCVNLPYDAAEYIYENAPLDTPVFLYW